jgi:thioredoxin reductase (NADPH)
MTSNDSDLSDLSGLFAGATDAGSLLGDGSLLGNGSGNGLGDGSGAGSPSADSADGSLPGNGSIGNADSSAAGTSASATPDASDASAASANVSSAHTHRVVIVGSGPAGWTAALYLGRAGFKPLVIAGALTPGGQLVNTSTVENYPGFPDGVQGPDLMQAMQKQAEKFGATVVYNDVTRVTLSDDADGYKTLVLDSGEIHKAQAVILTTGSQYRHLNVPGEKEYGGHGVSYCATCDGFFFRGKKIAVVGGGDSAFQDALFLTRFADVTLIHRREGFRASKVLVDRARTNQKIDFRLNATVSEITGDGQKVTGVTLSDPRDGSTSHLVLDGLFVAIGMTPNTAFLGGQVTLDDHGYIVTDGGSTRTNLPGVFAAGDVADPVYQQAVSAAGMGCRAALDAQAYLDR